MLRLWWPYGSTLQVAIQATMIACVMGVSTSCGESDPDIFSEVSATPDRSDDADGDAGTSSIDGGAVPNDTDEVTAGCEGAYEDLGVLSAGDPTVLSRTLNALEGRPASCTPDGDRRGEYIFAFEVDELAIAEVLLSATTTDTLSFALYEGSCEGAAEVYCSRQSPWRELVEPQKTYFLKVQAGEETNRHTFNASIGLEPAVCVPDEPVCAEGASERCVQGTSADLYACAGECSTRSHCEGDMCETAVTVEPEVGGEPVFVAGERRAYSHQWNAAELTHCEASESLETGQTTAMELFVRVPNLHADQTLEIGHAGDGGSYLYFVLDDCGAEACREAMFVDGADDNRLVWQVHEDGDYIVVIEALSNTSRPFQFDVTLR